MRRTTLKKGTFFIFFILLDILGIGVGQKAVANSYAFIAQRTAIKTQDTHLIKNGNKDLVLLLHQKGEVSQPSSDPFADVEGTDTEWGEYVH